MWILDKKTGNMKELKEIIEDIISSCTDEELIVNLVKLTKEFKPQSLQVLMYFKRAQTLSKEKL